MYEVEIKKIKNTDKFRPAAVFFEKNGFYHASPEGTTAFFDYWNEEIRRSLEGYEADGDYISGYHYFYLNYCRILQVKTDKKTGKIKKVSDFPRYYDYDRAFFLAVDEAKKQGKHLAVLKARRKGYSYKIAAMLVCNFYLIKKSNSLACASEAEFLTKDGILTKAWDYLDFIDEHTAWYKKRQKTDTKMHKRASMVIDKDGVKIEVGYKSDIMGVTLKNDVNKARGKSFLLGVHEEGGKYPNLKIAWQIMRPSVEQGSDVFGMMIVFGTGGGTDSDYEGLKDIFYEPDAYNCLPIKNVWDDGAHDNVCGFFVPDYYNLGNEFMDDDGNSDVKAAIKHLLAERKRILDSATDRTAVDRYIAEHCFSPMEATLNISSNIFPKAELTKHLAYIRNNKKVQEYKQVGDLVTDNDGSIKWQQAARPKDLTNYRLRKDQDVTGQTVVWEHPVENAPYGLYIAACDPYDHNEGSSLGSIFIYKRYQEFDKTYDILVAEYTGRPKTADDFYEITRKLLVYYNAKMLFENQNPGILTYYRINHSEYLLADQPDIIDKIIKNSKVNRAKGVHMPVELKIHAEGRLKDKLLEKRSDGRLWLHTILSEPLLEELISYNPDGNFDRVSAMLVMVLYNEELYNLRLKENKEENKQVSFFSEPVFMNYYGT